MAWLETAASLVAMRPTARIDAGTCTRRHASGCTLCVESCPKAAITVGEFDASVDTDACVGCGLCVTACPVDAIDGVGQSSPAIATSLEEGRALRCDVARLLGPDDEDGSRCSDVPCLAGAHPEALAAGAMAAGGATVVTGPCARCPVGSGDRVRATLERAGAILSASGVGAAISRSEVAEEQEPPRRRMRRRRRAPKRAATQLSRRSLFGLTSPTVPEEDDGDATFAGLAPMASARATLLASAARPALPTLEATPDCTACGGCVRACPTEALSLADGTLTVSPTDCVACGECVRICPEDALRLGEPAPAAGPQTLIHVDAAHCSRCGRSLGPGESGQCHGCVTRGSLVAGVWAELG